MNGLTGAWFDFIVLAWLLLGWFRGRKNGMSMELGLFLTWLAALLVGAFVYRPLGQLIGRIELISSAWAYKLGYLFAVLLTEMIITKIRIKMGGKFVSDDFFGKMEYYFGMMVGILRFACIALIFYSFLNSSPPTDAQIATVDRNTKDLEDMRFNPLKMERDLLENSVTGRISRRYLNFLIMSPDNPPIVHEKRETLKDKEQQMLDDITNPGVRK